MLVQTAFALPATHGTILSLLHCAPSNLMKLQIKNMVCPRCILVVEQQLAACGLEAESVELGEVVLKENPTEAQRLQFAEALKTVGFEILDDRRQQIAARIKAIIVRLVHHSDEATDKNLSVVLTNELPHDYSFLSNLFSEEAGMTIEKFHIAQRIERVKELLLYGELTLTQIAYQLGYSSVAYLSNQFKKVSGQTPSAFRQQQAVSRQGIDAIGRK